MIAPVFLTMLLAGGGSACADAPNVREVLERHVQDRGPWKDMRVELSVCQSATVGRLEHVSGLEVRRRHPQSWSGNVSFELGWGPGPADRAWVPATIRVFREGLVALRRIPAGSVLKEADLALATVDVESEGFSAVEEAVGRRTRRVIAAGRPVRSEDLSEVAPVRRGDRVVLEMITGNVSVRADAVLLAQSGQDVSVRVVSTGRVVRGRFAGPGLVIAGGSP